MNQISKEEQLLPKLWESIILVHTLGGSILLGILGVGDPATVSKLFNTGSFPFYILVISIGLFIGNFVLLLRYCCDIENNTLKPDLVDLGLIVTVVTLVLLILTAVMVKF